MIRITDRKQCCGCSACADSCPQAAITMKADAMGFRYPSVDPVLCVDCGICEKVCAFHVPENNATVSCEAIRFPDLMDSSQSGGLAYALMRKAISNGYIVYGAAIDDDFSVRHRRVDSMDGLSPLRLSKYVQSDMDGIPAQVLKDLKDGRKVLFTGTPCQCAGVASAAGKMRMNLLLADIICHGVPSPAVWKGYLESLEHRQGKKITSVLFRDPSLGWHGHREAVFFGDEKQVGDEYTFFFYQHLMLRPSCSVCPFASLRRASDITMADCWGVEDTLPGFADDNRGCSVLFANTPAGQKFTGDFPDICQRRPMDLPSEKIQPNLYRPSSAHKRVKSFENTYIRKGYDAVLRRFGKGSRSYRIDEFIKKVKRHI